MVALQEMVRSELDTWTEGFLSRGYSFFSSVDLIAVPGPPHERKSRRITRKNFNAIASRHPVALLPGLAFPDTREQERSFPEKYLAARVTVGDLLVDIHNAHLPPGSTRGLTKVEAFAAIRRRVDKPTSSARILCGDFNTPWSEDDEGFQTAAHRHSARIRQRWDKAERSVLQHPQLRDVYRATRPSGTAFDRIALAGPGQEQDRLPL